VNEYGFVGNGPLGHVDALGLATQKKECSKCGPDVTPDIVAEIKNIRTLIRRFRVDAHGWVSRQLWFASLAASLDYHNEAMAGNIANAQHGCPSEDCKGTFTLCGKCITSDTPGNLLFGLAAEEMGISAGWRDIAAITVEAVNFEGQFLESQSDMDLWSVGRQLSLYLRATGRLARAAGLANPIKDALCRSIREKLPADKERKDCPLCPEKPDKFPSAELPAAAPRSPSRGVRVF